MATTGTTKTIKGRLPRKGLKSGVLTEWTIVGNVKPGHEKEIRKELTAFFADPRRGSLEGIKKIGIHHSIHMLYDHDRKIFASVSYENDFDKYFDLVFNEFGTELYERWARHLEGYPEGGLTGGLSGNAGLEFFKNWLTQAQTEATNYSETFSDLTLTEEEKARRVLKAFQKVLDHPEAEQVLQHPALKPLLEEAAD